MRQEWADDRGARAAAEHRKQLVAGFAQVRAALDAFKPDAVIIWGDDQYENFKEDLIPPFAILAYDDLDLYPWAQAQTSSMMKGKQNAWGEDESKHYRLRGRPDIAKHLVTGLLEQDIDVAYAYKPLHHGSVAHAFTNAILYLDYHRKGYEHPTICFPLNCYGRKVVSAKGFVTRMDAQLALDPPSPSPKRFMQVGAATARVLKASPWRVALVASSSWSHAFLCDPTFRLRPDTPADRKLYEALRDADYDAWRATPLERGGRGRRAAGGAQLVRACRRDGSARRQARVEHFRRDAHFQLEQGIRRLRDGVIPNAPRPRRAPCAAANPRGRSRPAPGRGRGRRTAAAPCAAAPSA